MTVTFGRLAVIDFELGMDVIVYLFTVLYLDFARWSILDVVDSRRSVNVGHMYCVSALVYSGLDFSRCQRSI